MIAYNLINSILLIVSIGQIHNNSMHYRNNFCFIDTNKIWYIEQSAVPIRPKAELLHKLKFGKDTVINSKVYRKILHFVGDSAFNEKSCEIYGYVRETSDKKVYFLYRYFDDPGKEILIYDFNVKPKDTIKSLDLVVTSIDTVKIQYIPHKRIKLWNFCMGAAEKPWIEGLGDFTHIMNYDGRTICDWETGVASAKIGGSSFRLVCVTKGNRIIFKDTTYTDDYWINLDVK